MAGLTEDANRVQLILFDIDGTLVDTFGAGRDAIDVAFDEVLGVPEITGRNRQIRFAGNTDRYLFRALARAAEIADDDFDRSRDALHDAYVRALTREMARPEPRRRVMPGVRELLGELASRRDVRTGLITGNLRDGARIKLEPFDLNRYFAGGGFGSDHHDRRVVARRALDEMERLTGVAFKPERVTVVGDTDQDVDCAHANGFRSLAVETGWCKRESLVRSGPDHLLPDLANREATLQAFGLRPPGS